jgi:hypothetical protein
MARVSRTISIRLRRPTTIVLAFVESSDGSQRPYKIYLDKRDMVCCSCPGWKWRHTCSHLMAFRQSLASATEQLAS